MNVKRRKPKLNPTQRIKVARLLEDLVLFQHHRGWALIAAGKLDEAARLQDEVDKSHAVLKEHIKKVKEAKNRKEKCQT
jgi:hypothetical protein